MQILTGHNNLRRHRHLMGLEDSPICQKCYEEEETSEHFVTKCPVYWRERRDLLGEYVLGPDDLPGLSIKSIIMFIDETGRFDEEAQN